LSAPAFWLDVRVDGDAVVIGVHGELDAATAGQLSACAAAAVDCGNDDICFDLDQVTFIDSCGTRVLVSTRQSLAATGRTLYLDHPSDRVRRLLELSGLDQHFALRHPTDTNPADTTPTPSPDEIAPPGDIDRWARCPPRARRSRPSPSRPRRAPTAVSTPAPPPPNTPVEDRSREPSSARNGGTVRGGDVAAAPISTAPSAQHGDAGCSHPSQILEAVVD